jgi:hypothetical protein
MNAAPAAPCRGPGPAVINGPFPNGALAEMRPTLAEVPPSCAAGSADRPITGEPPVSETLAPVAAILGHCTAPPRRRAMAGADYDGDFYTWTRSQTAALRDLARSPW